MRLRLTNNVSLGLVFETDAHTFVSDLNATLVEYRRRDELKCDPELQIAVPVPGEGRVAWISPNYSEPKICVILDAHAVRDILKSRGVTLWKKIERAYEASLAFQEWFRSVIENSSLRTVDGKPHLELVRGKKPQKDDSE